MSWILARRWLPRPAAVGSKRPRRQQEVCALIVQVAIICNISSSPAASMCATIVGGQPITGCCDAPLFKQKKNLHCNPIVLFMHARQRACTCMCVLLNPEVCARRSSGRIDQMFSHHVRLGQNTYTVKKRLAIFPSPAGMSLTTLSLGGNNFIIPGQGEFGQWHSGSRRENQ